MDTDKKTPKVWSDEGAQLHTIGGGVMSGPGSGDDAALERLGKVPVLRRSFGFVTLLGFSCTILITWEATLLYAPIYRTLSPYLRAWTTSKYLTGA